MGSLLTGLRAVRVLGLVRESWRISWPMILIMLLEFTIGLTDVFIAGRIGKEVQAAVGLVSQIYFIFVVAANALTVGTVAVIARLATSERREELPSAIASLLLVSLATGVVLSALGVVVAARLIGMLAVPEELKGYAVPLIAIYAAGLSLHYLLINSNGILRATRRVNRSLVTMAAVCAINVGLNFIFVFKTPLGFHGIALSTVAALGGGCLLNLAALKPQLSGRRGFDRAILRRVMAVGWPSALLQAAWQTGATLLFLILGLLPRNSLEVMAALTNGLRVEGVIFLPAYAMNMANAVLVGNLMGENRREDAFRTGVVTASCGVLLILALTLLVIVAAPGLARLLSSSPTVIDETVRYIYISMLSEPFMAWAVILGGALNGAGDTRGVMQIVILSLWLIRLPAAWLGGVLLDLGPAAVWWSMNASILAHSLLITRRYWRRKWLGGEWAPATR